MSFVSRALGVHINPIKGQYSGFGNAMRDVAYAVAAYYAAPLLLGGAAGGAAAGAAGAGAGAAGGAAGAGAAGAGALTEFTAPEIAAMGGGLTTGAAGAGIGAGTAGAGSGASGFMKYAKLANMMPQGGGQQQQSGMRDWTQPATDYMPKTQEQLLAEALAKQQNSYG